MFGIIPFFLEDVGMCGVFFLSLLLLLMCSKCRGAASFGFNHHYDRVGSGINAIALTAAGRILMVILCLWQVVGSGMEWGRVVVAR